MHAVMSDAAAFTGTAGRKIPVKKQQQLLRLIAFFSAMFQHYRALSTQVVSLRNYC